MKPTTTVFTFIALAALFGSWMALQPADADATYETPPRWTIHQAETSEFHQAAKVEQRRVVTILLDNASGQSWIFRPTDKEDRPSAWVPVPRYSH
jgi:hypothetical protein